MKFRHRKVKREHGIIKDALGWLEELGCLPEVSDIIPGVIEVSRSPERGIVYKYPTKTGCKLLLKSNGSIQEAFVVTKNPQVVQQWIESRFGQAGANQSDPMPVDQELTRQPDHTDPTRKVSDGQRSPSRTAKTTGVAAKKAVDRPKKWGDIAARQERSSKPRRDDVGGAAWERWTELAAGDLEAPSLGDILSKNVRRELRKLQQLLPSERTPKPKEKLRGQPSKSGGKKTNPKKQA